MHIVAGGMAIVLFWVPLYVEKGKLNHRRFGTYYKNAMYSVALSGAIMSVMVLAAPLAIKGHLAGADADPEKVVKMVRTFWAFLLYLSLLSYVTTRHAVTVLTAKGQIKRLRSPLYISPIALLAAFGPALAYLGVQQEQTLHIIFGILGTVVGVSTLRYCYKKTIARHEWVIEHLSAMIGSGIGAYTAFLAFGGRVLFSGLGQWQIVFWIAPGVIGMIASYLMTQKYSKLFSGNAEVMSQRT
jgi:positive regulator of sigma E activity